MESTTITQSEKVVFVEDNHLAFVEEEIQKCIAENPCFNEEAILAVKQMMKVCSFKEGTILLKEGEIAKSRFHIFRGCVRQYYLIDGEEKTTFFFTEGQCFSAFASSTKKVPSTFYLACTEDSVISVVSIEKELEFYRKCPQFESMSRLGTQEELGDFQEMMASYITSTPEERYLNLMKTRPELMNRVPQYQLASYLGIKPESLSRIRKRIMTRS